jgi:DNA topoisomerase-1
MQLAVQKHKRVKLSIVTDPVKSAKLAGLRYVSDDTPGIERKRAGKSFSYVSVDGKAIRDTQELNRFKALVIPPAWTKVWICPLPNGHLQATGRDEKGRKQYRYHPDWQRIRSQTKFNRMIAFGSTLPLIRSKTEEHLSLRKLSREKVLAAVVRLLEITCIRVGNVEYAKENNSFGLTTMCNRHVDVSGSRVKFQFRGKSGVQHELELNDRRLARIVKQCRDLPGYELFQYFDENGDRQTISSEDVNAYLQEITGEEFTAKDFRTWSGTVAAAQALTEIGTFTSQTQAKNNITQAIKQAAKQLGNRPATCRKYYVHPVIIDAYLDGKLLPTMEQQEELETEDSPHPLSPQERGVLAVLEQQLLQHEE